MLISPTEFKEFLLYIGIIKKETEENFQEMLELIHSSRSNDSFNRLSIEEILSSSLECYLRQMTNEQRKEIAVNIVQKFKENKLNSGYSKLIKLMVIFSKFQVIPLYSKFLQWKSTKEVSDTHQLNTQQEEIFSDSKEPIERTRNSSQLTRNKHNLSRSMRNFMERQEKFKKTQSKSIAKVMTNNEIEYTMLCTFSPQINHQSTPSLNNYMNKVNQKNPHLRLYEESKLRLTKKEQSEKERNDQFASKNSKNPLRTPNKENPYVKQYEDYKVQTAHKKRLKERIENESDCTFKPTINPNASNRSTSRLNSNVSRSASQSLIEGIMTKARSPYLSPKI